MTNIHIISTGKTENKKRFVPPDDSTEK